MRDDFPEPVKVQLAKRVGYRCSNPTCRKLTTGPGLPDGKTVNIGVAAHISAASPGGKRYDPNLSPEERRSINNGIWLFQVHAKLIDDDETMYPVGRLRAWKTEAEYAALAEIHGLVEPGRRTLEEIQRDFDDEQKKFNQEIKESRFNNLRVEQGALGIIIAPEPPVSIDLGKFGNEIQRNLRPFGRGNCNFRPFGDYFQSWEPGYNEQEHVSVIRLYSTGKVLSATSKHVVPYEGRIIDWAITRSPVEHIYDCLKLLDKILIVDSFFVGMALLGLPPCELSVSLPGSIESGEMFTGGDIPPPAIQIQRSELGSSWKEFAPKLKPILEFIWREFGFQACHYYDNNGTWASDN